MSTADHKRNSHPKYQPLPTEPPYEQAVDADDGAVADGHGAEDTQCGLGGLRCRCLQVLAHPNSFVALMGLLYLGVYGSSGIYLAGVISTIEKRFQLKSSESGLLMSLNDISALCGVLFVAHLGGKFHRPRIIGISGLVVALGSFLTALPQFLFDNSYAGLEGPILSSDGNQSEMAAGKSYYEKEFLCEPEIRNSSVCTAEEIEASGSQLGKTWALVLGQLLAGLGMAGMGPLSVTYVDDAVEKSLLPMYLSLIWLPMTIAPLIGFSLSGYCLSVFADFYKTDAAELEIDPQDPQWQGAWWLGFVLYGCFLCLVSVPFFFFPRKMQKPKSYCCFTGLPECCQGLMGRVRGEGDAGGVSIAGSVSHKPLSGKPMAVLKDFLASLGRLLTNVVYMFSMGGFCLWVLSFGGFAVFSAKYIQFQFGASPSEAGILLGFAHLPGSLIGIVLGGIVTSRLAGSQLGYAIMTLIVQFLAVLVWAFMILVGCPNIDIAGVTTPYGAMELNATNSLDVFATCNMNCMCEKGVYSPVCGSDNVTYVTACFAGCEMLTRHEHEAVLQDCTCIGTTEQQTNASTFAVPGACASTCGLLMPYVILIGVTTLIGAFSYNPSFMMYFRSVLEKDRDLAMGFMSFLTKTAGFIPGPVIFGALIEGQCSYWQESCHETGECLLYDRPGLRLAFLGLTTLLRLLAVFCFCGAAFVIFKSVKNSATERTDEMSEEKDENIGDEELKEIIKPSRETEV